MFTTSAALGRLLAAGLIAATVWAQPAASEDAKEFFRDKTLTIIVGTGPGTGYDNYARLFARYFPNYLPVQSNVIVQNMLGVSGLKAAGYIYSVATPDGRTIALGASGLPELPLMTPKAAPFDSNKFSWIGSATKDIYISYLWHTAPIKTYEEAKKTEVIMGGTSAGSPTVNLAILSNVFFGTKFKIVSGYSTSAEMNLAMEKGEIHGAFINTYSAMKSMQPTWVKNGMIRVFMQHGFKRHADFPDVPLFIDQAKTEFHRQALELVLAPQEHAKPFYGPPNMPTDRLDMLRRAFDTIVKDPEFLAVAQQTHIDIVDPMTGEELAAFVANITKTPRSVVDAVEKILADQTAGAKK